MGNNHHTFADAVSIIQSLAVLAQVAHHDLNREHEAGNHARVVAAGPAFVEKSECAPRVPRIPPGTLGSGLPSWPNWRRFIWRLTSGRRTHAQQPRLTAGVVGKEKRGTQVILRVKLCTNRAAPPFLPKSRLIS